MVANDDHVIPLVAEKETKSRENS